MMFEVLFYFLLFLLLAPFAYCFLITIVAVIVAYWEFIGEQFMKQLRKLVD